MSELGCKGLDQMSRDEKCSFQLAYFLRKEHLERDATDFLVERSFVDVAAFWIERDMAGRPPSAQSFLLEPCRELAQKYDLHIYMPLGAVPYVQDGWRSSDLAENERIDHSIKAFLGAWQLPHITMPSGTREQRVAIALRAILSIDDDA
jgi:hypothetical protein